MAWTTPRTWNIGEFVTKAIMDTHIRDNLTYLKDSIDAILFNVDTTIASSATPAPIGSRWRQTYIITALAANATFGAPTGSPIEGNMILIKIKDDGTNRTLTWNAIYDQLGIALPTTTTANKVMYCLFRYNAVAAKWELFGYNEDT